MSDYDLRPDCDLETSPNLCYLESPLVYSFSFARGKRVNLTKDALNWILSKVKSNGIPPEGFEPLGFREQGFQDLSICPACQAIEIIKCQ